MTFEVFSPKKQFLKIVSKNNKKIVKKIKHTI